MMKFHEKIIEPFKNFIAGKLKYPLLVTVIKIGNITAEYWRGLLMILSFATLAESPDRAVALAGISSSGCRKLVLMKAGTEEALK